MCEPSVPKLKTHNKTSSLCRQTIYAPNGVVLLYMKGPGPPIDDFEPEPLPPIAPDQPLIPEAIIPLVDPTAGELTALFQTPVSGANIHRSNLVRTDSTDFNPSLSGTSGRFGAGVTARISRSIYLYGEYDYLTGDHLQQPWAVDVGLRFQW